MPRKPKQPILDAPGMAPPEPPSIPEVDEKALDYAAARDKRISASGAEQEKYKALVEVMGRHNLENYRFTTDDGEAMVVEKVATEIKIKVHRDKKAEKNGDQTGDED